MDTAVYLDLGGYFRLDILFDLVIFAFQIFKDCGLLDDVVGEFLPFHVSISIYIDLVKQISQIAYQPHLSVGQIDLPETQMFGCDCDELLQHEHVVAFAELVPE